MVVSDRMSHHSRKDGRPSQVPAMEAHGREAGLTVDVRRPAISGGLHCTQLFRSLTDRITKRTIHYLSVVRLAPLPQAERWGRPLPTRTRVAGTCNTPPPLFTERDVPRPVPNRALRKQTQSTSDHPQPARGQGHPARPGLSGPGSQQQNSRKRRHKKQMQNLPLAAHPMVDKANTVACEDLSAA